MQAGERRTLGDLGLGERFSVQVTCDLPGTDVTAFGLQDGRLSDDRYMVFYNQPRSPEGALRQDTPGTFALDLPALPPTVTEVVLTATHDDRPVGNAGELKVRFGAHTFDVKPHLHAEKAVMLLRVYRHAGGWRLATVAQGFNGGLAALVAHFGGEVATDAGPGPGAAAPASLGSGTAAPGPAAAPVSLVKARQDALLDRASRETPGLVSLIKAAGVSLDKQGLGEARYRVKLVLDISASMHREYESGAVQALAERALALAARLDDDGVVEVYLFGVKAHRRGALSLDNAPGFVERMRVQLEGGTHYNPVMTLVREDLRAEGSGLPALVLFVTDGGTSNRDAVVRQMTEASREPTFWKFMGIDQSGAAPRGFLGGVAARAAADGFGFLEKLDDLQGRAVDNADFFRVPAPISIPDPQLFDLLVNELGTWQRDARRAGILR